MKRQFSRKRNALLAGSFIGPVAIGATALVLLILALRFLAPGALTAILSPFWQTGSVLTAGVGNATDAFGNKDDIAKERDALKVENATLAAQNAALTARAVDLARLLGNRTEPGAGILAGVLMRPPVSPYDVLVIDAGSDEGVRVGASVFAQGGIPAGTIESVTGSSARVLLYSAPGRATEAWVGEARIAVTLEGAGGGSFSATVAREAGLKQGDPVFLPGPGALPVGTIVAVEESPSSPRSRVEIQPVLNPFSITWVTVAL